ncbi:uncharacterized protein TNIN_17881 [Trichonephila inaurata madagascariensis]|uniref:Uncharacterized protein n=1 Tax=Trichonephila inaurata madagascariensis TaxID=2747483 RepID=A0A8X7BRR3_9ARAC|nr:uncharacterized protein TNIN_17881 [Trichonephila inaurata madagascariensis]
MSGIFAFGYAFVFMPPDDYIVYLMVMYGIIQNFLYLLLSMLPAAGCNRASNMARNTITSLPGWFPQQYKLLKMLVCQRYKNAFVLTLWKMYIIDEPLLMSALGTLVTYGFLVANISMIKDY